jgi:hypothetical protein
MPSTEDEIEEQHIEMEGRLIPVACAQPFEAAHYISDSLHSETDVAAQGHRQDLSYFEVVLQEEDTYCALITCGHGVSISTSGDRCGAVWPLAFLALLAPAQDNQANACSTSSVSLAASSICKMS